MKKDPFNETDAIDFKSRVHLKRVKGVAKTQHTMVVMDRNKKKEK